jgi:hypothetical protein
MLLEAISHFCFLITSTSNTSMVSLQTSKLKEMLVLFSVESWNFISEQFVENSICLFLNYFSYNE